MGLPAKRKALPKSSEPTDPVKQPENVAVALQAAYWRLLGYSQEFAADKAGVSARSVGIWEKCSWWREFEEEARRRWLSNLTAHARRVLLKAIKKGDATKAMQLLERVDPDLAPKSRHEITGADGGPLKMVVAFRKADADD